MNIVAAIIAALCIAGLCAFFWISLGGADWLLWQACGFIRGAVRAMKDNEDAETWAARFRSAADEGLRDRDARKDRQ